MVLECINAESVTIEYENGGATNIYVNAIPRYGGGNQVSGHDKKTTDGGIITWEFQNWVERRRCVALGTCTVNGESRKWGSQATFHTIDTERPILTSSFGYYYQIPLKNNFYEDNTSGYSLAYLLSSIYEDIKANPWSHGGISGVGGRVYTNASGLTETDFIWVGKDYFRLSFYKDGELWGNPYVVTGIDETLRIAPEINIDYISGYQVKTYTKSFSKLPLLEAIEVLPDESKVNLFKAWKVQLDSSGNEQNRFLLFTFQTKESDLPPQYTISCGITDQCPPDSCEVDCGTHICCYGSDGIAVHSFNK